MPVISHLGRRRYLNLSWLDLTGPVICAEIRALAKQIIVQREVETDENTI